LVGNLAKRSEDTAKRNHSVFDADQCADLQSAILGGWAELFRDLVSCGFLQRGMQRLEELRSMGEGSTKLPLPCARAHLTQEAWAAHPQLTHRPGHLNTPRLLSVPSRKHNDPARYSQFAALVIIFISYQTAARSSPCGRVSRNSEGACLVFWSMHTNSEAEECRQRALECAQKALQATDPAIRLTYAELAELWSRMAEYAEALERPP
jgi:hypothetical protein